jgi:hypothetical protein
MGYTTMFYGQVAVEPPFSADEIVYLHKFAGTRRMQYRQGPYYVDRGGLGGQATGDDVLDYNSPPEGQPGLWCHWVPTEDGSALKWDGGEKFYNAAKWMKYLIGHFIGDSPLGKTELPFLHGHICNGYIAAHGEDPDDRWKLVVENNQVFVRPGND